MDFVEIMRTFVGEIEDFMGQNEPLQMLALSLKNQLF